MNPKLIDALVKFLYPSTPASMTEETTRLLTEKFGEATEVKNVMVPMHNPTDESGRKWLVFQFGESDKDPWKWPKVVQYQDRKYMWRSWNSDNHTVNYLAITESELATIVRKRI